MGDYMMHECTLGEYVLVRRVFGKGSGRTIEKNTALILMRMV